MKTIAITFTISTLCMGILFFAYQANEAQAPRWNTQTRAVAVALGATDRSILRQTNSEAHIENDDAESMHLMNDKR